MRSRVVDQNHERDRERAYSSHLISYSQCYCRQNVTRTSECLGCYATEFLSLYENTLISKVMKYGGL